MVHCRPSLRELWQACRWRRADSRARSSEAIAGKTCAKLARLFQQNIHARRDDALHGWTMARAGAHVARCTRRAAAGGEEGELSILACPPVQRLYTAISCTHVRVGAEP